jgi:hypothetical protein
VYGLLLGLVDHHALPPTLYHDHQLARVRWYLFASEDDDKRSTARRRLKLGKPSIYAAPHCRTPSAARGTPVTTNSAAASSPG